MTSSSSARPSRRPTRGRGAAQGRPKAGAGRQKSAPVARPQEFTMPEPLTPALPPVAAFEDMGMPEALLKTLAALGVTDPFPIQAATLPNSLAGRDLLGRGRTGSGKTLAFGLALLARTAGRRAQPKQPLALVLVPTRELAQQVTDALAPYATAVNLRIATVVGGMSINRQSGALRRGSEVLVATPGRLKDLIDRGDADLSQVSITVLDEADQMTDMGFMPQVTALLKQVEADGQTMLFSATLDKNIDKLVKMFLHDPVAFSVDPSAGAVSTMEHHVLYVMDETDKKAVATRIAARDGRVIMFVDTKRGVDRMVKKLLADGVRASGLHGGRSQPQRNRTLDWFKTGEVTALVATNVAARGIHIDDLDLVVNVDPPTDHKDYLHRGGRTARAGESGSVVTLVLPDQKRDMTRLMSDAGISPRTAQIKSSDAELSRLTGAKEPSGVPVVLDVPQPTPPKPRSAGRSGGGSTAGGARRRSGGGQGGAAASTTAGGGDRSRRARSAGGQGGAGQSGARGQGAPAGSRGQGGGQGGARTGGAPAARRRSGGGRPAAGRAGS
ncbi:DEAD/DEAH box helicase [Streptomyces sp. NPDC054949]|uniref:DEAD/DEAH box helicase n=1 Tax=unclassified Streptomyces TaxID=2593676 RepID=UPI00225712C3|nr:DEAD/DEAH box helicase [Streptomyces sp. NBC_00424]MCX5075950.1 DEAD/DEAH box helicase [Streptomyces sp. NBC_00424]WUD40979.1 DEAD/DEAH box helicase [Streptomyces sp. NBC_00513]